jgi:hypothetical protein
VGAVTAALTAGATRPLATVNSVLAGLRAASPAFGVPDGLVVDDPAGWLPATALLDGTALDLLLDGPARTWGAQPHAAAALAYKQYTYWLAMPAVLGWATCRRVPLCDAGNVLVRCDPDEMLVRVGLLAPRVAVRPDDPLAGTPGTVVVDDLLATLRDSLLDRHVTPLVAATRRRVRIGAHTLYGQLAASVAYVLAAAETALLDPVEDAATAVLSALGLADLAVVCGGEVRRSTCCLAFVVDGLGRQLCSDCCVQRR